MFINKLFFGSGVSSCKNYKDLLNLCRIALSNNIYNFDTAPSYGTESLLSKALKENARTLGLFREDYVIQTKIDPIQMYNGNVEEYFKNKLKEIQLDYVDSLLIHWPIFNYLYETWDSLVKLKEQGYTKSIGICNLRITHLKDLIAKDIKPEILQIERHPLNTFQDEVSFCLDNNIVIQDYSPLCKMHPQIKNNESINLIASKYNCSIGQVILKWHIDTGTFPIFTSTKPERIIEYSKLDYIKLSSEEIKNISLLNCNHKIYLESLVCPGF